MWSYRGTTGEGRQGSGEGRNRWYGRDGGVTFGHHTEHRVSVLRRRDPFYGLRSRRRTLVGVEKGRVAGGDRPRGCSVRSTGSTSWWITSRTHSELLTGGVCSGPSSCPGTRGGRGSTRCDPRQPSTSTPPGSRGYGRRCGRSGRYDTPGVSSGGPTYKYHSSVPGAVGPTRHPP